MFEEVLRETLKPILQAQYSPEEISSLASNIANSLEGNPREADKISFLRSEILGYLTDPSVLQKVDQVLNQQTQIAQSIETLSSGLSQLENLSAAAYKTELQALPVDSQLTKDIFNLNFGAELNLGEVIYKTRFNQGFTRR